MVAGTTCICMMAVSKTSDFVIQSSDIYISRFFLPVRFRCLDIMLYPNTIYNSDSARWSAMWNIVTHRTEAVLLPGGISLVSLRSPR